MDQADVDKLMETIGLMADQISELREVVTQQDYTIKAMQAQQLPQLQAIESLAQAAEDGRTIEANAADHGVRTLWSYCCDGVEWPPPECALGYPYGESADCVVEVHPFCRIKTRVVNKIQWDGTCLWEHYSWVYIQDGRIVEIDSKLSDSDNCRRLILCTVDCETSPGA